MSDLFSERLRALRAEKGLKQREFAKILGITAQNYNRYERGRIPRADILSEISAQCGVTVDWMLGRTEERKTVYLAGSGETHVLRDAAGSYGEPPAYHTVRWQPQWNTRAGAMQRKDLCALIEDSVPRLRTADYGEPLQHLCHYLMDILNELANRKAKDGGGKS